MGGLLLASEARHILSLELAKILSMAHAIKYQCVSKATTMCFHKIMCAFLYHFRLADRSTETKPDCSPGCGTQFYAVTPYTMPMPWLPAWLDYLRNTHISSQVSSCDRSSKGHVCTTWNWFAGCSTQAQGYIHYMLTNVAIATASFSTRGSIALDNGTAQWSYICLAVNRRGLEYVLLLHC